MPSISIRTSLLTICEPRVAVRAALIDLISRCQEPPKWGALGGLKQNLIWYSASWAWREGWRAWKAACNSLSPPLKLVPRSECSSAGFPRRDINLLKAIRKESVLMLDSISIWTALVVRHLKSKPQRFSFRRPTLTCIGPKQSIPVEKKAC